MKVEFEINKQKAIETIIKFQNGKKVYPAIRELIQNSIDSNATEITIIIRNDCVIVKDNGVGMTKEQINRVFKILFETDKTSEDIGEFGVGRTQIMNFGPVIWLSQDNVILVDITKFIGYELKKRYYYNYLHGTNVICSLSSKLDKWDIYRIEQKIKKMLFPVEGVDITINGSLLDHSRYTIYEEFSDKNFDVFKSFYTNHYIYNKNIFVEEFKSNFDYCVNSKRKIPVNFARNEFLSESELTKDLYAKINEVEVLLVEDKTSFSKDESVKLLQMISVGKIAVKVGLHKHIILGIDNKKYTLDELIDKEIMFGDDDVWSRDCIRKGHIVINSKIRNVSKSIIEKNALNINISKNEPKDISQRGYYKDFEVESLRRNKVYGYVPQEMNDVIFSRTKYEKREVYLGNSDIVNSWTDGDSTIWIDKSVIEANSNKMDIYLQVWNLLCHEYSHTEDSQKHTGHDCEFYEIFYDITTSTIKMFGEFCKNINLKFLQKKYIGE